MASSAKRVAEEGSAGAAAPGESVFASLDPLDPRKVSLDIFELYCQEMLTTPFVGRRVFLIKKMRVSRLFHTSNYYFVLPARGRRVTIFMFVVVPMTLAVYLFHLIIITFIPPPAPPTVHDSQAYWTSV